MDNIAIISAVVALAGVIIGIFLGKMIFAKNTAQKIEEAELQAQKIIEDAKSKTETLKEKKILEAKEHFLHLKTEHEKETIARNQKIAEQENKSKKNNH
jgi:ribonuclease Y